ncbi:MAG TPA: endolytic transglycosylase MltG [Gammaproteobacteria bacterium]|jgi:UPF0755 protein|nr:endolytic transglycosylase MltG [Gammaproteobacteria bacterium]
MIKRAVLSLLLLGIAGAAVALWQYRSFVDTPLQISGKEHIFVLKKGWSARRVGRELAADGLLSPDWGFDLYARVSGKSGSLQAGEYRLTPGLTPPQLLALFVSGDVTQYRFAIIEGWTVRRLREALAQVETLDQTLADVSDTELMERLGKPNVHPEGQFLPDTYRYTRGMTDFDVLQIAHRALHQTLDDQWDKRPPNIELNSAYEVLTLASIIEKETGVAAERPQISGVFNRRLRIGMRLQTDPTVIYGMGDAYEGNIRRRDLTTDTPYNTYTRHGLPPSPIALAGRDAIHAALHPQKGEALYFVARGDGSHQFSATLEQHNAAVRKYQLKQ